MDKAHVILALEPISQLCSTAVLSSIPKYNTDISADVRLAFDRKAKSIAINRIALSEISKSIPASTGFQFRTLNGLPCIVSTKERLIIRVKQLDKRLCPMNIPTEQQARLSISGLFNLNEITYETLIFGYQPAIGFQAIQQIVLFPNKNNVTKEWMHRYYTASTAIYFDFQPEHNHVTTSDQNASHYGLADAGTSILSTTFAPALTMPEIVINEEPIKLPDSIRIRTENIPEVQSGTDPN